MEISSADTNGAKVIEIAEAYCRANGLGDPPKGWESSFTHPPESPGG